MHTHSPVPPARAPEVVRATRHLATFQRVLLFVVYHHVCRLCNACIIFATHARTFVASVPDFLPPNLGVVFLNLGHALGRRRTPLGPLQLGDLLPSRRRFGRRLFQPNSRPPAQGQVGRPHVIPACPYH